ncbi:MAG TPA: hypothetical protein VFT69_08190 [Pseudolabrys sp.]|nr:hypothetical protein [Pseudolabrys sp.]
MSAAQAFDFNAVLRWALSPDACAWLASALVLATFSMKRMIPLRLIGISSNVGFFTYAMWLHLTPVIVLHGLLFPINVFRLWQCLRHGKAERRPASGNDKPPAVGTMSAPARISATWCLTLGAACTPMYAEDALGAAERWQAWSTGL